MISLRAVAHGRSMLILTALSLCGCAPQYGGARCHAITLATKPSSLPLREGGPVPAQSFRQIEPFILGTGELACCVPNTYFTPPPTDCGAVDCEAFRQRLTVRSVGGEYFHEPCGPPSVGGVATCSVYLDGETIVGVRAYCLD